MSESSVKNDRVSNEDQRSTLPLRVNEASGDVQQVLRALYGKVLSHG